MKTTQHPRTRKNLAVRFAGVLRNQWQEQQYLQELRLNMINEKWEGSDRRRA
ncbi:hypothetical protein [Leekyejoonella antrihumi]|uniref:hypothetical protein n=1 Tax=Leekyejoonella antrihumi TaxID=1660198 RepID=UPI0016478C66|nr:hypothetical protein [Leekyejoonella antrihumi]